MNVPEFAITVNDLEKSLKQLKVVNGISFQVKKGTIFALLGQNGAGKTTTIKILSTLLQPDNGSVEICGFDVRKEPEKARSKISLTGQHTTVDEWLTGRENLLMIGSLFHIPSVSARVDQLLERFGLVDAADRRVATYSSGMRRRLDLAMSLVGSPAVIFLDEPTVGLDPHSRLAVWSIIRELTQSGVTVFLTTQYLEEADQLADHIAILNGGRIIAEGTATELKRLLPNGVIELGFDDHYEMSQAYLLLSDKEAAIHKQNQTITVRTDGSVKQLTEVFSRLENENIRVRTFAQKQPTLEDVFLELTGENLQKENV